MSEWTDEPVWRMTSEQNYLTFSQSSEGKKRAYVKHKKQVNNSSLIC